MATTNKTVRRDLPTGTLVLQITNDPDGECGGEGSKWLIGKGNRYDYGIYQNGTSFDLQSGNCYWNIYGGSSVTLGMIFYVSDDDDNDIGEGVVVATTYDGEVYLNETYYPFSTVQEAFDAIPDDRTTTERLADLHQLGEDFLQEGEPDYGASTATLDQFVVNMWCTQGGLEGMKYLSDSSATTINNWWGVYEPQQSVYVSACPNEVPEKLLTYRKHPLVTSIDDDQFNLYKNMVNGTAFTYTPKVFEAYKSKFCPTVNSIPCRYYIDTNTTSSGTTTVSGGCNWAIGDGTTRVESGSTTLNWLSIGLSTEYTNYSVMGSPSTNAYPYVDFIFRTLGTADALGATVSGYFYLSDSSAGTMISGTSTFSSFSVTISRGSSSINKYRWVRTPITLSSAYTIPTSILNARLGKTIYVVCKLSYSITSAASPHYGHAIRVAVGSSSTSISTTDSGWQSSLSGTGYSSTGNLYRLSSYTTKVANGMNHSPISSASGVVSDITGWQKTITSYNPVSYLQLTRSSGHSSGTTEFAKFLSKVYKDTTLPYYIVVDYVLPGNLTSSIYTNASIFDIATSSAGASNTNVNLTWPTNMRITPAATTYCRFVYVWYCSKCVCYLHIGNNPTPTYTSTTACRFTAINSTSSTTTSATTTTSSTYNILLQAAANGMANNGYLRFLKGFASSPGGNTTGKGIIIQQFRIIYAPNLGNPI